VKGSKANIPVRPFAILVISCLLVYSWPSFTVFTNQYSKLSAVYPTVP
jgi:hypothetical protein